MSAVKRVRFGYFLTERKVRIKPAEANSLGLKRVDKIDFSANIHLSERVTNTDMILVKPGDLLISGINAEKGAVTVYQGAEDVLASIHYSSYEYDPKKIDIEFLKWFLKSSNFKSLLLENSTGGIKTELKSKHLLPLEIDLPDLNIQKSIVQLIESRSGAVKETSSEIAYQLNDLQRLRQSILEEAVQGKLVPQDKNDEPALYLLKKIKVEKEALVKAGKLKREKPLPPISETEIPFELPKGWVWCRLGEIITTGPLNGFSPKANKIGVGVRCLTLTATTSGYFKESYFKFVDEKIDNDSYLWLSKDDILIQRGNSIEYVGIAAIYEGPDKTYIFPDLMIKIRVGSCINSKYIHRFLISSYCRKYFESSASGTQTTMPKINQTTVVNTLLPIPPLAEQLRIVSKVESMMNICDTLEAELKSAQSDAGKLLQALLQEAFKF